MDNYITIKLSMTNCYLIKTVAGYLLIDCGNERDKNKLIKKLKQLHISLKDINYLLLTHHHNDHCGLLNFIISENPSVQVIMSDACANFLKIGKHYKSDNEHYSNKKLKIITNLYNKLLKTDDNFKIYEYRPQDIIITKDIDELFDTFGLKGKIIITSGHTEDSISFIIGKTAFVGDAMRNFLNFTGSPYLPILLYSEENCLESIKKLKNEDIIKICPAHGNSFKTEKCKLLL
ncbi:MAG: hypothetical protein K0S55_63 [Clostridia bacterium]|nr:hypothetical protein [Clostridia bacterium]